jgi:hypothetical protein
MSPIHVTGDVTVPDGIILTINSGVTIQFDSGQSLIIIGALHANGTSGSGNQITFTAAGTSWGHIYFNNSTGNSNLHYCVVEKGNATGLSPQYGGGVLANTNNLTISNCDFRNNSAGWGGGILLYPYSTTTISNSLFRNNSTTHEGAGIYFFLVTKATVINCMFESNTASGTGGGMFIGGDVSDVKIINSTIINNTATSGSNILFALNHNAIRPFLINCIIWGSSNSIYYHQQTPQSTDFINCAIQDPISGSTTNCITLNSANSDVAGPNFINPSGGDYSISFVSPCRDAGTASGAPSTDILGKFRIELPDIGAYEVQYSNWTGAVSTSWSNSTNWSASVDPSSGSGDVVIPFLSGATPNYPIGTPAPDFTIGTGKTMILRPGAEATFGTLTNNGTLRLEEDVTGISSLIYSSYSGNNSNIQLFLPGGGSQGTYRWHYISSPVTVLPRTVFVGTLDLARYDESLVTNNQDKGWVAFDGYIYSTGQFGGTGFSNLDAGIGYNHYLSSNHTYAFSGFFNSGNVTDNLAYNSINSTPDYPNTQGYNLLGNPFPSCLDWSQIAGATEFDPTISQAIYFNYMGKIASWINGTGTNGGTSTIPPMQGFFVKASTQGKSVTLPMSACVHSVSQIRYKKGLEIIPLVRLKIEDQLNSDDAVVRFDEKATTEVDNAFDAFKFTKNGSPVDIWTTTSGADLSINGLPFPNPSVEIPVSFYSNAAGNLKITGSQIDGLENYSVILTDNVTNTTIDLKTNPSLSFAAPGGEVDNRFTLKVLTITTAVPETTISNKAFNIYSSNRMVNIQTLNDIWNGKSGGIRVLDMTGRVVTTEDNVTFSKDELHQLPVSAATGIYMVEIRSGGMRYVGKVIIR